MSKLVTDEDVDRAWRALFSNVSYADELLPKYLHKAIEAVVPSIAARVIEECASSITLASRDEDDVHAHEARSNAKQPRNKP